MMKLSALQIGLCTSLLVHGTVFGILYVNHQVYPSRMVKRSENSESIKITLEPEQIVSRADNTQPVVNLVAPQVETSISSTPAIPKEASQAVVAQIPIRVAAGPEKTAEPHGLVLAAKKDDVELGGINDFASISATEIERGSRSTFVTYLSNPKPLYPKLARKRKEEGLVILTALVSSNGTPEEIEIENSSGFDLLDDAAIDAVRCWRFVPASFGTIAIASRVKIPVRFKLSN